MVERVIPLPDDDVHPLGGPEQPFTDPRLEEAHAIHPRSGGIDHLAGPDRPRLPAEAIADLGAGDPAAFEHQAGHLHVVCGDGPRFDRALEGVDGHAGVVGQEVVVPAPAQQPRGSQMRLPGQEPVPPEHRWCRFRGLPEKMS